LFSTGQETAAAEKLHVLLFRLFVLFCLFFFAIVLLLSVPVLPVIAWRTVSETTYNVSSKLTHSVTHSLTAEKIVMLAVDFVAA